jgi:hypothetical protein
MGAKWCSNWSMPNVPKIGHFHVISKYLLGCHKYIFTPHNNQNNSKFLINNQILLKSNIRFFKHIPKLSWILQQ